MRLGFNISISAATRCKTGGRSLFAYSGPRLVWAWALLALALSLCAPEGAIAAGPRPTIVNQADLLSNAAVVSTSSTTATYVVRTTAVLEFLKYAPTTPGAEQLIVPPTQYRDSTGALVTMAAPVDPDPSRQGATLDLNNPIPLITANVYHGSGVINSTGEPIFLRLTDDDQNLDPERAETVEVILEVGANGEREVLILTETGPDTGVFMGYVQTVGGSSAPGSATGSDGLLSIFEDAKISAIYIDNLDEVTTYEASALVDPFGIVFDTSNGKPVDGAKVTLMNASTEQPATVYGDDGVSPYPSTLTTGGIVQDSSGRTYSLPPGGYRFPFVQPGNYRLDVVTPDGYRAPSTLSLDQLRNITHAGSSDTFAIDENGSLGKQFTINPGPALHIDIPVDPLTATLWVTKTAAKSSVAIGDFLQYRITVENTGENAVNEVQVGDRLPLGFRYRKGSTKLGGVASADPSISEDGRTLTFSIGTIEPTATTEIKFVVEIAAGARVGKAVNLAAASGSGGATSNTARAEVQVTDEFFRSTTFIVGRVFPNGCSEKQDMPGVAGVRIYLEDGTYAITDKNGMYHFEGVKPGTHVVQLDLATIPEEYVLVACDENTRFAGTAYSQFVDLQGGALWRADFYLARIEGKVGFELRSMLNTEAVSPGTDARSAIVLHPHFESGSAELSAADKAQLDRLTASLKGMRIGSLSATGHTDSQRILPRLRPAHPDNYALSRARAQSIADYLAATLALEPGRVSVDGRGPDEPVADNGTPGGRALNRRVELKVTAASSDENVLRPTGEVEYEVPIRVGGAPLRNLRLSVTLPPGVVYLEGTSRLGDKVLPDPEILESVLTYGLGNVDAQWEGAVRLSARIPVEGDDEELVTRAMLTFDSGGAVDQTTPGVDNALMRIKSVRKTFLPPVVLQSSFESGSAVLTAEDKAHLDRVAASLQGAAIETLHVTGHTDAQRLRARLRPVYPDNYALSVARANSVAQYLTAALKLSPERVVTEGKGHDEPVASNETPEGMARNRRVVLHVNAMNERPWYDVANTKDRSGLKEVELKGSKVVEATSAQQPGEAQAASTKRPERTEGLLSPADGSTLATRICAVRACLPSKLKPRLLVDGKEVPSERIGFTMQDKDADTTFYSYIGVDMGEAGERTLVLQGVDPFGNVRYEDKASLTRSGDIASIHVLSAEGNVADGKTPVKIRLQFFDSSGKAIQAAAQLEIREGTLQPFAGEKTFFDTVNDRMVQVDADGWASFQPVAGSGPYRVVLAYNKATVTVETYVKPEMRDWILVGLAEGTLGYNTATGNMESLGDSGEDLHYYDDGRLAFYAKGRIKGSWLLTLAFDSGKTPVDGQPGMYQTVDPNKYYVLYGDGSAQAHDAASAKKLYVKLERDQFYALFGDYATGMTVNELSRYSRNLTGFKSEMKGEKFSYTAFASDTNQAYVKDEIRGDGTSGLYHLSRKNIVLNSEKVTLVTRDRFQSEVVVSEQALTQWLDYSIDYESGTIFFKSPVFSTDESFNPVFIVVEYESFDDSDTAWIYGGRGAVKLLGNRAEVGATYVHEAATGSAGDLTGVDATFQVTPETKVRAEVAETRTDDAGVTAEGSAYLAEVQHRSEKVEGKAYVRRQDQGFGLGQQAGSETGTSKVGGDLNYRITKPWTAGFELYRQETLSTGAVRDVAELKSQFTADKYSLLAGLRHAEDTLGTGEAARSEQVYAGLTYRITERLAAQLQHDQSVGPNNNADYPTRTTVGLDYKLNETATLFAAQEWTNGSDADTETSRIGIKASPWTGGQVGSTVEQQTTENGARLFSTTGLKQTWQVSKRWTLDAGLDRSRTIRGTGAYDFNTNAADSSGSSEDFTAVSLGAGFREEKWAWTTRVENRDARTEDKLSTFTGANGEVRDGLALAGSLQTFRTESSTGTLQFDADLRIGLAYRPRETRVIVLDRLDLIEEKQAGVDLPYDNWRVVNNFVTNLKNPGGVHTSLQYGAKYVRETIDEDDYRGYTDLMGLEGRFDITKYCDLGLRGQRLHSWDAGQSLYGLGASVGFNTGRNVWLSLGYNLAGFTDSDFSKSDFTAEGPFIKLRLKFDQVSVREAVKWMSGQ